MQRLFTMFPAGLPGVGLLLLRSSAAIALFFAAYPRPDGLPLPIRCAAIVIAITLAAGCLTPIVAVLALLIHGLIWLELGSGDAIAGLMISLDLIALAMMGPGGYSVDAAWFGRRRLVLPLR